MSASATFAVLIANVVGTRKHSVALTRQAGKVDGRATMARTGIPSLARLAGGMAIAVAYVVINRKSIAVPWTCITLFRFENLVMLLAKTTTTCMPMPYPT